MTLTLPQSPPASGRVRPDRRQMQEVTSSADCFSLPAIFSCLSLISSFLMLLPITLLSPPGIHGSAVPSAAAKAPASVESVQ